MNQEPSLRPDYREILSLYRDTRSPERLRAHYELEKRLAGRLRNASSAERVTLYPEVYGELFQSLPDHPQSGGDHKFRERHIRRLIGYLRPFLRRNKNFLEIGCGDAILSMTIASHVKHCFALDVTDELIDRSQLPVNLEILLTSSTKIPLSDCSIDVALSDQLMEHLHPDDAQTQLAEIYRILKPGGSYHCLTPNRVTGPHDVSHFFEYEAHGFHLKEYDSSEILALFKAVGFRRVKFVIPILGLPIPQMLMGSFEQTLLTLPRNMRAWVSRRRAVSVLVGLNVIGIK